MTHKLKNQIILTITLLVSLCAGFFVYFPITDGDIFWHLASGREIIARGAPLFNDPFSYTTPGIEWIDLHWLFQVSAYMVYLVFGYYGLLIIKATVVATAVFFLLHPFKSVFSAIAVSLIFLYAIFQFRYLVPLRPGVVTLLYLSLFIRFVLRFTETFEFRYCIPLVTIQILWVNTQGLFLIGPAVFAAYLAGWVSEQMICNRNAKRELFRFLLDKKAILFITGFTVVAVVSIVNPYGIRGLLFPLRLFERITPGETNLFSNTIDENLPLFKMVGTAYQFYVTTFFVLAAVVILTAAASKKMVKFGDVYLCAGFTLLAYMAQRNLILFAFALLPLLKRSLENVQFKSVHCVVQFSLLTIGLVCSIYVSFGIVSHFNMNRSVMRPVAPFSHPQKSIAYLKAHPVAGHMFNADRYGGYCLWQLYPKYQVYIDTRLTIRDKSFFEEYLELLETPQLFETVLGKYGITSVMLPASIPRYTPLIKYLYNNPEWSLVVADGSECLFLKNEIRPTGVIRLDNSKDVEDLLLTISADTALGSESVRSEAGSRFLRFVEEVRE
jgi:hypothetical protein